MRRERRAARRAGVMESHRYEERIKNTRGRARERKGVCCREFKVKKIKGEASGKDISMGKVE